MTQTWIFDLDNTLYPADLGLFDRVDGRIVDFMIRRLGIAEDRVRPLREEYWKTYGLTLVGLMTHFGVDPDDYLAYVHDVPLADFLEPDPGLAQALESLAGPRVIFTNGSRHHARAVLGCLGVEGLMEAVYDIGFMDYQPKPKPYGYEKLLRALGAEASECCLIDDLPANLDTGRSLGMGTVLVGSAPDSSHQQIPSVKDLPDLFRSPFAP